MVPKLVKSYKKVVHGVSFIPLAITIILTLCAIFLTTGGQTDGQYIYDLPRYLRIEKIETTRSLLSSILTGMIALTVFGFSMMMVVVNQAASIYSPKVVDTILDERSNKVILGVYLGTIVFTIVTMMKLDNGSASGSVPHLAVFANILLQVVCVFLFVAFINHISKSVRVTEIIQDIFQRTRRKLEKENDLATNEGDHPALDFPFTYAANYSGYFQVVRVKPLLEILRRHDLKLKVLPNPGDYCHTRTGLFSLDKPVREELEREIRHNFVSYSGEAIEDNAFYGFRQLREIAVKALSPGVNDPGVARLCIDHIGDLLSRWILNERRNVVADEDYTIRLFLRRHDFETLLTECLVPVKIYGKRDYTVVSAILLMLSKLKPYDENESKKSLLNNHVTAIMEDADRYITNSIERRLVNDTLMRLDESYFRHPCIQVNLGDKGDA